MTHDQMIKITKALADSTRFRILQAIAMAEEISCGTLANRLPITQATCSQHLKILADAGLIAMRREAQFHYYHLVRDTLEAYHRALDAALANVKPVTAGPSLGGSS